MRQNQAARRFLFISVAGVVAGIGAGLIVRFHRPAGDSGTAAPSMTVNTPHNTMTRASGDSAPKAAQNPSLPTQREAAVDVAPAPAALDNDRQVADNFRPPQVSNPAVQSSAAVPPQNSVPESLHGEWAFARGPRWARSITVLPDGTLFADLPGVRARQRGRMIVTKSDRCSITFHNSPEMNIDAEFLVDSESAQFSWSGELLVLARPRLVAKYRSANAVPGNSRPNVAANSALAKDRGQTAPAQNTPSSPAALRVGGLPAGRQGWTRIAVSGDQVPGSRLKDARFTEVGFPVLNNRGDVAFPAEIEGKHFGSTRQVMALYRVHADMMTPLVEASIARRRPDEGPSVSIDEKFLNPGATGAWLHAIQLDSKGRAIVRGSISPSQPTVDGIPDLHGDQNLGYVRVDGKQTEILLSPGQAAPGIRGAAWVPNSFEDDVLLGNDDDVLFPGRTFVGSKHGPGAIWHGHPGSVTSVYVRNQPLPGGEIGYSLHAIPLADGRVAAHGQFLESPDARRSRQGLWIGPPDDLQLIAEDGKPIPGGSSDLIVDQIRATRGNARGDLLVEVGFRGGPNKSLWKYSDGRLRRLPQPSSAELRGFPRNVKWVIGDSVINSRGDVAVILSASIDNRNFVREEVDTLWVWSGSGIRLLLREDGIAGVPGTTRVKSLGTTLAMNAAGQIVITPEDSHIWLVDKAGDVSHVVSVGETLQFADGDQRVVAGSTRPESRRIRLPSSGGEDGRHRCLTDDGKLAFKLSFKDGSSGVFFANPASNR